MEAFLIRMGIEKAFDSSGHNCLISTLEKDGFGKNFILWVKILLRDHVLLTVVQLQSTSDLGDVLVKVTQFQRFCLFYLYSYIMES